MEHQKLTDEISEELTLYALGALDEVSSEKWETHLAMGCPVCRQELTEIQSTLAWLAYSVPVASPPAHSKARLFERIRASWAPAAETRRVHQVIDFSSLDWQPSECPGVSFHRLRYDEKTGTIITLVKFQPRSTYPAHRHPGGEDCLILQGAFRDRRGEYRLGDYVYYEPGSVHHDLEALDGDEGILFVVAHGGIEVLPSDLQPCH
jgi:anti-sigma factor ChrR (cupin superfamily)